MHHSVPWSNNPNTYPMTITSGTGIHHDIVSGQGTVGAWLIHPSSGLRYGLSCNHVVAALGHAQAGNTLYDQGRAVGALHAWLALQTGYFNTADAALFAVPANATLAWPHPVPIGNAPPSHGLYVYKHGATTGLTHGRILDFGLEVRLRLRGVPLWFEGIIAIEGAGQPFSDRGDSGALVLDATTNEAVGVLFARNEHVAYAYPVQAAAPLLRGLNYAA